MEIKQYRVFSSPEFKINSLPDNGRSINEAAFSLIISRAAHRTAISQYIDDLMEGVPSFQDLGETAVGNLRARVTEILSVSTLDLIARAHNVLLEHSQTYTISRIISDVRPVFNDDVLAEPLGAVLVHMLSVVYRSAGRRENFVVALDEKDVDQLIDVLERARNKAKTLKALLDKTAIPHIKVV